MNDRDTRTVRVLGALAAVLLSFTIFLQNTIGIYSGNTNEFALNSASHMKFLFPLFLFSSVLIAAPLPFLNGLFLRLYSLLILSISVILWLYSNIILLDFGVLDGRRIQFDFPTLYLIFEIVGILITVFLLTLLIFRKPRILLYGPMVLIVGAVGVTFSDFISDTKVRSSTSNPKKELIYQFSSEKNLIIVLMDTFQSDIFWEIIQNDPALKSEFEGFIFYPDTLGTGPTTYLTMPSIHSGNLYEPGVVLKDYYEENVTRGSFMNALAEAGHEVVHVSPPIFGCPEKVELCIHFRQALQSHPQVLAQEVAELVDLSMFRAAPIGLKEFVYSEGRWHLSRFFHKYDHSVVQGNRLLEQIAERAVVTGTRPTTKFVHLLNTHPPFILDSDCRYTGDSGSFSRDGMIVQARCAIRSFLTLMQSLKSKGIYDQSLVMLIADTGSGLFNLGSAYIGGMDQTSYMASGLIGGANPIFLLKPLGAQGDIKISEARVQISDVAATVCDILDDCGAFEGVSAIRAPADQDRARRYNHFYWQNRYVGLEFIPGLVQYQVEGPLWDLDSWPRVSRPILHPGKVIDFTGAGLSNVYRGHGWTNTTDLGTWTDGSEAVLYFEIDEGARQGLELTVHGDGKASRKAKQQEVDLYVNDVYLDTWTYQRKEKNQTRHATIPKDLLENNEILEVKLKIRTPYEMSRVNQRKILLHKRLGVQVREIVFDPIPEP